MATYHILVPTDYSACSDAALRYAVTLARVRAPAKLTLLHVEAGMEPLYDEQLGTLEPNRLMNRLKLLASERAVAADIPIDDHVVYGDPTDKIREIAEEMETDLIVMGTHGRTGLNRALMGSTAESVLRSAPCPVLLVKAETGSFAESASDHGGSAPPSDLPHGGNTDHPQDSDHKADEP